MLVFLCSLVTALSALFFCCDARLYQLAAREYCFSAFLWPVLVTTYILWSYCCGFILPFPLWHKLFALFQRGGLKLGFALLFFLQITFNYWTCHPNINSTELPLLLQNLFNYRLNYLPLHYLFIFMLGGLAAIYYNKFIKFITSHFHSSQYFLHFYTLFIGGSYYYYYFYYNYSLIILVNTFQQLSLQGFLYTIASPALFLCCL